MDSMVEIECHFCGDRFPHAVDFVEEGESQFTVDCETCCRPMDAVVVFEDGEIVSVSSQ